MQTFVNEVKKAVTDKIEFRKQKKHNQMNSKRNELFVI